MTAIKRLSLSAMIKETGMPALGYANPKKKKIFLLKGLNKKQEKEVLAHEAEHIRKGEEGPFIGAIIGAGASLLGSQISANAQRDAASQGAAAADPFGSYRQPFAELLLNMYGMQSSESGGGSPFNSDRARDYGWATGFGDPLGLIGAGDPQGFADPLGMFGGGGLFRREPKTRSFSRLSGGSPFEMFRNLPGYQFSLSEMMRAVTRGAAGTGGIGSGRMFAELQQRAGGLAEQTFDKEMARLMTLAGADKGSPATAGTLLSQGISGAGESRAAGIIGVGNALGYGFGGGGSGPIQAPASSAWTGGTAWDSVTT